MQKAVHYSNLCLKKEKKTKIMSKMSTHNDNPMQTGGEETEETTDVVLGLKIH